MTDYRPVSCQLHSELELAALRGEVITIAVKTEAGPEENRGKAVDLITRAGAEYLLFRHLDGRQQAIRLDRLTLK